MLQILRFTEVNVSDVALRYKKTVQVVAATCTDGEGQFIAFYHCYSANQPRNIRYYPKQTNSF